MAATTINVPNDSLNVLGLLGGVTTLSGGITADYTANTVTGGLAVTAVGLLPAQNYSAFTITQTGVNGAGVPLYTITAQGSLTNFSATYTGQNPTRFDTVNINLLTTGVSLISATNAPVTSVVVCFAAGTLIRTIRGEVAVEDLRVGDFVETTSGKSRRVVWLGNSDLNIRLSANPMALQPIRIAADAFGPGMPYRTLTVSPGHALCVPMLDEVLVPACVLVNDTTITRLDEDQVSYWHVELDAHDILYANGLPSESYIDVGNRTFFVDGDGEVDPQRTPSVLADYCRPYVAEGVLVKAMREQLRLRAEALGWRVETSPFTDLHLEADGARVEPTIDGMTARFELPAGAEEVWLESAASVPAHVADSHDTRRLGVLLQSLRIGNAAGGREVALDDPSLGVGFHPAEAGADGLRRWTAGHARLPAALWHGVKDGLTIEMELAAPPLPKWVAPVQAKPVRDVRHLSLVAAA